MKKLSFRQFSLNHGLFLFVGILEIYCGVFLLTTFVETHKLLTTVRYTQFKVKL